MDHQSSPKHNAKSDFHAHEDSTHGDFSQGSSDSLSKLPSLRIRRMATGGINQQISSFLRSDISRGERQEMARAIGQIRGNRYLSRVLDDVQRDATATGNQDIAEQIREIHKNSWVGPLDEYKLQDLWGQLDLATFLNQSDANYQLFLHSISRGAELEKHSSVKSKKPDFGKDVKAIALGHLQKNEEYTLEEMKKIGLGPEMCLPMTPERQEQLGKLQELAQKVKSLDKTMLEMQRISVGYDWETLDMPGGGMRSELAPASFNPDVRPHKGPNPEDAGWPTWDMVNAVYTNLKDTKAKIAADYPAIYVLIKEGKVNDFADKGDPQEAQMMLGDGFNQILANIKKSRTAIETDDLDYRELQPIHQQLFGGKLKGSSGTDWSKNFEKWVGKDDIGDYESTEFWITLGLGAVSAVAFIVAEIATAGTATFFIAAGIGAVASGTQAAMSWEKYADLSNAAGADVKQDLALVTQDQANAALFSAVLDTAFAFLDLYGPIKAMRGAGGAAAVRAAAKAARMEGLKELTKLPAAEAKTLLERAVAEKGVKAVKDETGLSIEDLIKYGGGEESEIGKTLRAFEKAGGSKLAQVADVLPNLATKISDGSLTLAEADDLVRSAISDGGAANVVKQAGGWQKLAGALGDGSMSGKLLKEWRQGVYEDLRRYIATLGKEGDDISQLIQKTGTDAFTSDLDISLLGKNASKNRDLAFAYLESRLGVGKKELSSLLHMDLFTDPRRLHLYDGLDPVIRAQIQKEAAELERSIIFNARLKEAMSAQKKGLEERIRKQMADLGIAVREFEELNPARIEAINGDIDRLHGLLEDTTDLGRRQALAKEIAEKQAYVNASEKGGYFSGGGTRRFVTERDAFPGFGADDLSKYPIGNPQIANAVFDQLPKLDKAAAGLKSVAGAASAAKPDQVFKALKDFGKYGDRLTEMAQLLLGKGKGNALDDIAERLKKLIESARPDEITKEIPMLKALEADKLIEIQRGMKALEDLDGLMDEMLNALSKAAELGDSPKALDVFQNLVQERADYLIAKQQLINALHEVAETAIPVLKGAIAGGRATDEYLDIDDAKKDEPNQSKMPAASTPTP